MAKSDDNTTGIKSISKSARTKGAREAKRAKLGLIAGSTHGGVCSGCGQKATSCTPGSTHEACPGFYLGSFQDEILDKLQEQALSGPEPGQKGAVRLQFDGTSIENDCKGRWVSELHIAEKRDQAKAKWTLDQQTRIILTSVFETRTGSDDKGEFEYDVCVRVDATNGFGEPMECVSGVWQKSETATLAVESPAP